MALITLSIPQVGQPDATEDPKIATDFSTLQTLVNGQLDTTNLSPTAGITAAQLAPGAIPAATGGLSPVVSASSGNVPMTPGELLTLTTANGEGILPSTSGLAVGTMCGLRAGPGIVHSVGASGVSIFTNDNSNLIYLPGATTATNLVLLNYPGAFVILIWDGSFWETIAGGADWGWLPLTLGANVAAADSVTPAYRKQQTAGSGNRVALRGALVTSGTINSGTAFATVSISSAFPAGTLGLNITAAGTAAPSPPAMFQINSSGVITAGVNVAALSQINLNGASYSQV